jgi:MOSC domain-containing protein
LTALPEGRVAGDRALGFRFADSPAPDVAWSRKHEFVALVNTPGLARLDLRFDHDAQRLRIASGGSLLVEDALDAGGRKRIEAAVQDFVLGLAENPLAGHPERVPLRLVGDGITPRYQDNEAGQITLHSLESLAAVAAAVDDTALDGRRFRSNIVIEGVKAWDEQDWFGRRIRIGRITFDVVRQKVRCLATHANPATGERDLPMMAKLMSSFGQKQPTFAVGIVTSGAGGEVRVGDEVALLGL